MAETVLLIILLVALAEVIKKIKNNRPTAQRKAIIFTNNLITKG